MISLYGIYRNNSLVYIGQTCNLYSRFHSYKSSVKHKDHKNMPIMRAMIKYGFHHFEFHVLCEVETTVRADVMEQSLIGHLNPRYNVARGGSSTRGKYTKEIRQKISAANRRRPRDKFRVIPIVCIETGEEFFSIAEAGRRLNIGLSNLRNHVCGISRSAGGLTFRKITVRQECSPCMS